MAKSPRLVTESAIWAGVRLTRPWNVLMIVVAMYLISEALLSPRWEQPETLGVFALGTLAMATLAAGANVINDYFDVAEDRVNRPDRALVGRVITRRQSMALNYALTGVSILATCGVCWAAGTLVPLAWIAVLGTLLWGYSPWFKRRFLRGNLVIAASVAQLPLWCVLLHAPNEIAASLQWLGSVHGGVLLAYVGLSGYVTLLREITKDWQDASGDGQAGYDTLPVRWGEKRTQYLLQVLHWIGWILMGAAWWASYQWMHRPVSPLFFVLPYAAVHLQLTRGQIASVSAWQKLTLAGGLLYLAGML